jgi:hypothetical protein
MPRQGILATAICAGALLVAAPAVATASPAPPKLPGSTHAKGVHKCKNVKLNGAIWRVYVVRGHKRYSCRKARAQVKRTDFMSIEQKHGWSYWDWTKGGNPPWSDVWMRGDRKVVIGGIVLA